MENNGLDAEHSPETEFNCLMSGFNFKLRFKKYLRDCSNWQGAQFEM